MASTLLQSNTADTTPLSSGNIGTDGSGSYFPICFPVATTPGSTIMVFAGKFPGNGTQLSGTVSDPVNGAYGTALEVQNSIGGGNSAWQSWAFQNAASIPAGSYGRTTAASTTTLSDNTQSWTTNQWAGKTLVNLNSNLIYTVLSNTNNTLTFAAGTAPVFGDCYVVGSFIRVNVTGGQATNDYATGAIAEVGSCALSGGLAHKSGLTTTGGAGTNNVSSGTVNCGTRAGMMVAVSLNAVGASSPFVPLPGTGFTDNGSFFTDDAGQPTAKLESKYFTTGPGVAAGTFNAQGADQFGTFMTFVQDPAPVSIGLQRTPGPGVSPSKRLQFSPAQRSASGGQPIAAAISGYALASSIGSKGALTGAGVLSGLTVTSSVGQGGLAGSGAVSGLTVSMSIAYANLLAGSTLGGLGLSQSVAFGPLSADTVTGGLTLINSTALGAMQGAGALRGLAVVTTIASGSMTSAIPAYGKIRTSGPGVGPDFRPMFTARPKATDTPALIPAPVTGLTLIPSLAWGLLSGLEVIPIPGLTLASSIAYGNLTGVSSPAPYATKRPSGPGVGPDFRPMFTAQQRSTQAQAFIPPSLIAGVSLSQSIAYGQLAGAAPLSGRSVTIAVTFGALQGAGVLAGLSIGQSLAYGGMTGAGVLSGLAIASSVGFGPLVAFSIGAMQGLSIATSVGYGAMSGAGVLNGLAVSTTIAQAAISGTYAVSGRALITTAAYAQPTGAAVLTGLTIAQALAYANLSGISSNALAGLTLIPSIAKGQMTGTAVLTGRGLVLSVTFGNLMGQAAAHPAKSRITITQATTVITIT